MKTISLIFLILFPLNIFANIYLYSDNESF